MACEHTGFNHCDMCGYTGDSKDARIAELEEVVRSHEHLAVSDGKLIQKLEAEVARLKALAGQPEGWKLSHCEALNYVEIDHRGDLGRITFSTTIAPRCHLSHAERILRQYLHDVFGLRLAELDGYKGE